MEKRVKLSRMIRIIAFLLCVAIVFTGVNLIVSHAKEEGIWINTFRIREMYNLRGDSVDVVSLGSSMSICSFSPMDLYRDYGISAYNAGSERQPIVNSYLILDEFLKHQKPKVVLLEVYCLFNDSGENFFRKLFDGLHWSREKLQVLNELSSDYLEDSKWSYVFPIMKFHNRYQTINKTDFTEASREDYYFLFRGYALNNGIYVPENPMKPLRLDGLDEAVPEQLNEQAKEYFCKIVNLCKTNGIKLVLYKTPVDLAWPAGLYNAVKQLAEQNGLPYIDFNREDIAEECGLDFKLDQESWAHQNSAGAVKLTKYLGKYLHENCDLPDRRDDPDYIYLDKELERYEREKFNAEFIKAANLSYYLDLILEAGDGYTAIISVKDDAFNGLDEELREKLKKLGLQSDLTMENAFRHSLIGVRQDGRVVYEQFSEGIDDPQRDLLEYRGSLSDGMKYYVKSGGWFSGNISDITINGVQYSKNDRGLNIVIYDSRDGRVVDSIVFDTCADAGITYRR